MLNQLLAFKVGVLKSAVILEPSDIHLLGSLFIAQT